MSPDEYEGRMKVARKRLHDLLAPESGPEKSITEWLGKWDEPTIEIIADMAERAYKRARAEGYDLGFREGGGRP